MKLPGLSVSAQPSPAQPSPAQPRVLKVQSLSSGFLVAAGLGAEIPSQSNFFQTLGIALCLCSYVYASSEDIGLNRICWVDIATH